MRIDRNNRAVRCEILPDLRLRVTDTLDILDFEAKSQAKLIADLQLAWGTAHDQYPSCLLIRQDEMGQNNNPAKQPNDPPPQLVRIYEQISPTAETAVGLPEVDYDQYGRKTVIYNFLQFSSGTPSYLVVGTTAALSPNDACILKLEERTNDGTLQRIRRTYIDSGTLSDTEEIKFDGKLLVRSITSLNSIPATPSGWTLVTTSTEFVQGLPVYRYQFINGNIAAGSGGVIDTSTEYEISPDVGVTGITRKTIKYISDPSVVVNPISSPGAGYVLLSVDRQESDGYVLWTAAYAFGTGVIASGKDIRENGLLVIYSKTSLNVAPTAPAPTIGGTVVLVKDDQRNGTRIENGNIVFDRTWYEGNGQIATHIVTRQDGLREVTFISIGTRVAPSGVLVRDDVQTETGYNLYTVSAMQAADGVTAVTGVSFTFGSIEKWTYPGRLKPFVAITGAFKALDVYKSPPVTTDISASIVITYQTSGTLTLAHTLWSPTDAAAMYSQWVGTNGVQHNLVESYPGYRYVSGGTANLTATDNVHFSIFNQPIINGNNATISATGGPVSPDGNTYCLRAHLEPAFIDTAGTIYYRKTEVFAAIPAQTALPV